MAPIEEKAPFTICVESMRALHDWLIFLPSFQHYGQRLFDQVTEVGPDQGKSSFQSLCSKTAGISLIREQWKTFEPIIEQGEDHLFDACINVGPGITAFHYLCTLIAGIDLLEERMTFFGRIIERHPEQLFTIDVTTRTNIFYLFLKEPKLLTLVKNHWPVFANCIKGREAYLFQELQTKQGPTCLYKVFIIAGLAKELRAVSPEVERLKQEHQVLKAAIASSIFSQVDGGKSTKITDVRFCPG